jgi:hypothetical protein
VTNGKAEVGRVRLEKRRREKISEEKEKEHAGAGKGRKVAIHSVFPMFCGSLKRRDRKAQDETYCRSCNELAEQSTPL